MITLLPGMERHAKRISQQKNTKLNDKHPKNMLEKKRNYLKYYYIYLTGDATKIQTHHETEENKIHKYKLTPKNYII